MERWQQVLWDRLTKMARIRLTMIHGLWFMVIFQAFIIVMLINAKKPTHDASLEWQARVAFANIQESLSASLNKNDIEEARDKLHFLRLIIEHYYDRTDDYLPIAHVMHMYSFELQLIGDSNFSGSAFGQEVVRNGKYLLRLRATNEAEDLAPVP